MKLDLSKFKKIESDDKCTTLAHPSGHKIKIAHDGLSPDVRKNLEDIPMHLAKGGYAKYSQKYDPNFKSKASVASKPVPQAAYTPPKNAADAFTEPDNQGTTPNSGQRKPPYKEWKQGFDAHMQSEGIEKGVQGPPSKADLLYPPCINPSCKSFGHAHPNCRCYGGVPEHSFAEGGSVPSFCSKDQMHKSECEYFKGGGSVGEASDEPVEVANQPQPTATPTSVNVSPEDVNPNPEATGSEPVQQDNQIPKEVGPGDVLQQKHDQINNLMQQEQNYFENDVNSGKIKPKTYSDLFSKNADGSDRGTLGKIGTIFGLMLSGAGSGLAHQDNALLGMMNNTIQNDLKAQQESQSNKQNLLKINSQNLMDLANAGKIGSDTKALNWATATAKANYLNWHNLSTYVDQLPDNSPLKQQGLNKLAILYKTMKDQNAGIIAQASGANALSSLYGAQGNKPNTAMLKSGVAGPEAAEYGTDVEQKTIDGLPSVEGQMAKRPIPQGHKDLLLFQQNLDDKGKDLLNYLNQHKKSLIDVADPRYAKIRAVAQQKAEEMKNFYNGSIQGGALTEGRLGWYDQQFAKDPTGIVNQFLGSSDKLKEIIDSNAKRRDTLLKSYGLHPRQMGQSSSPSQNPLEGRTATNPQGHKITFTNGKWQ